MSTASLIAFDGGAAVLELVELSKRFVGVQALDRCSLAVSPGTLLGFLGPNGAGKTTAMRSVFGLVRLDHGEVRWAGRPVAVEDRLRFGYLPEQRGLYPRMRIRDQITYFGETHGMSRPAAAERADRWLAAFGLANRAGDRLEQLSHGNQQRVQLAAALVHDPDLLVLDEPFAGLDPVAVDRLGAVLREQAEAGKAVLFSSHQLDLVEHLCEEVVTIDHGRVVMSGRLADLKRAFPYRRVEIEVRHGDGAWLPQVSGIVEQAIDGERVSLIVDRDVDLGALLAAAEAAGPVTHFAFEPPSLSDLFRRAVAP